MRYIFFGSPDFAAIILKKLIDSGMPPVAVVCNPDKPFGRKKALTPPPVKRLILEARNLKSETNGHRSSIIDHPTVSQILQPEMLDPSFKTKVSNLKPDFFIIAAYAKIIPKDVLAIPRLGSIGVHPSLLPKYRGATPIQSVILAGERETGTTLFMLDERVDHGPALASASTTIADDDDYDRLLKKLAAQSGELLVGVLPQFMDGKIKPQVQDEQAATYTKKFETVDGFVDLQKDAPEIVARKIKALNPDPGVFTYIQQGDRKVRMKLLAAVLEGGKLKLLTVQSEGKKPMPAKDHPYFAATGALNGTVK